MGKATRGPTRGIEARNRGSVLRDQGLARFPTYEDMKMELADWVADESGRSTIKAKAMCAVEWSEPRQDAEEEGRVEGLSQTRPLPRMQSQKQQCQIPQPLRRPWPEYERRRAHP